MMVHSYNRSFPHSPRLTPVRRSRAKQKQKMEPHMTDHANVLAHAKRCHEMEDWQSMRGRELGWIVKGLNCEWIVVQPQKGIEGIYVEKICTYHYKRTTIMCGINICGISHICTTGTQTWTWFHNRKIILLGACIVPSVQFCIGSPSFPCICGRSTSISTTYHQT